MRILSQNLLSKEGGTERPELNYVNRKEDLFALIAEVSPDLICFQEATLGWKAQLADKRFAGYGFAGVGREGNGKGEHNLVCWRKDKYNYVSDHTFWLTGTPDKVSKVKFTRCHYRICTYVHLQDKDSGTEFVLACTHLDNRSSYVRRRNAVSLLSNLRPVYEKMPFILCGDFNCDTGGYAYLKISEALHDTGVIAKDAVPYVTFHDFGKYSGNLSPIDFIFVNQAFTVDRYRVLNYKGRSGNFISDHYGVLVDVELKQNEKTATKGYPGKYLEALKEARAQKRSRW